MSYCRFVEADVYIFGTFKNKFECCACSLSEELFESFISDTEEEMLEHIKAHRKKGNYVPDYVDDRLLQEITDRDKKDLNKQKRDDINEEF
jgi:hypothetical protein